MEYVDLRKRAKRIGLNLKELSKLIGISYDGLMKWKNVGIPDYGITLIQLLERLSLEEREKFFQEKLGEK
jgi:hypothetical protein